MSPLARLWRYARPYRSQILLGSLFSFLNKAFDLAPPLLIGVAVDIVVQREASWLAQLGVTDLMAQLWVLAGATILIWGLESLSEYVFQLYWRNLAQEVQHALRLDTYAHVQGLELAYFEDRTTGGLMAVLNDDVNQLERFLDVGANDLIQVATTVVIVGAIFFALAPSVAWLAFLPVPVVIWGSFRFQRRIAPRYADVRERVGDLSAQLANNLSGITTIKSFTAETREAERVRRESDRYRASNRRAIRLSAAFVPLIRMAIAAGFIATLVLGGSLALSGTLAVGAYSVLVFMTQRLLWPLTTLGQTFDLYQRAMASSKRIFNLLDTQPTMRDGLSPLPLGAVRGELRLENVSFAYRGGGEVLRGLSLTLRAGQTTAIVGATGAGKSTLIKLLLRFYDPQSGRVTLDGHDLRTLKRHDLRRAIGYVSQDVFLFHGTVYDNIAYGDPDASREAVIRAAKVAEAHDFITALPFGYDTIVGERGQKLSGGQRQRISIARAVLKDPPILILDEATSAVDNETEVAIQRSVARLAEDRTVVLIAHRLSTVRHAHCIFVLSDGRLAEAGTHEALLARGGLYAGLWQVQTGERAETPISAD
ncbi:ABC transporter ATP-binding protein [Truepera radiovictrix]|nr:ABC transporter ATP-binding protein [Truepera radiovictrix]WMT57660.1 ABC transporter ATP-binding protein [Truepera radiovictrix]